MCNPCNNFLYLFLKAGAHPNFQTHPFWPVGSGNQTWLAGKPLHSFLSSKPPGIWWRIICPPRWRKLFLAAGRRYELRWPLFWATGRGVAREQGNVWISENRLPGYLNMIIATDNHLERILEKKIWIFCRQRRSKWWILYVLRGTLRTSKYQDSSLRTYRGI